jgi:hydroxyacylglutathione hydrolase
MRHGSFPTKWINGEDPESEPKIQTWSFDGGGGTTILRQSILTHWEAPFLYLIEGQDRALLLDTGTGDVDVREAIDVVLANKSAGYNLVVAHTHSHTDHVGGDRFFQGRPHTTVVDHSTSEVVQRFFEIPTAQQQQQQEKAVAGHIDLGGGRIIDVLFTPGHQASHLTFYDRQTQLLFTGDSLYPGRLTVDDWPAYRQSIDRLVRFVREGRAVTYILGGHIEMKADGSELTHQTPTHPNEHRLELASSDLLDLHTTINEMGATPTDRRPRTNFVVVPGDSLHGTYGSKPP